MIPIKLILKGKKLKRIWKEKEIFYLETIDKTKFSVIKFFPIIAKYIYLEL